LDLVDSGIDQEASFDLDRGDDPVPARGLDDPVAVTALLVDVHLSIRDACALELALEAPAVPAPPRGVHRDHVIDHPSGIVRGSIPFACRVLEITSAHVE
jgi:hypothetical protein